MACAAPLNVIMHINNVLGGQYDTYVFTERTHV